LLQNIQLVAGQVAILFIIMGAGGLAARAGLIKADGVRQMTNIVLYLVTPAIIIRSFLSVEFTPELVSGMLFTAAFAVFAHLLGILIASVIYRKQPQERGSVLKMAVTFSNCGFMGIPLATGVLGEDCVVYIAVYIAIFNLFSWTYGVFLFRPHNKPSARAMLINPGTVGLTLGLTAALLQWDPPMLAGEPIRLLASLNSPVAMIVLGYYLFNTTLRPQKGESGMWGAMAVKLLLIPAVALGVCYTLGLSGLWVAATLILTAAPSATNVVLFAARFEGNTALAARTVSVCTLLSMITMPLLLGVSLAVIPV
jgi:hypothetical protein